MLLQNKNAIVYGGGGAIGGAVARAFAREGPEVFLAGRTLESLQEVAQQIRSAGGVAGQAGPAFRGRRGHLVLLKLEYQAVLSHPSSRR